MLKTLCSLFADAIAFVRDPEARQLSPFTYANGSGMSMREARRLGLI